MRRCSVCLLVALAIVTSLAVPVAVSYVDYTVSPERMVTQADLVIDGQGRWALRTTQAARDGVLAFIAENSVTRCGVMVLREEYRLNGVAITPDSGISASAPNGEIAMQLACEFLATHPSFCAKYAVPGLASGAVTKVAAGWRRIPAGWAAQPLICVVATAAVTALMIAALGRFRRTALAPP